MYWRNWSKLIIIGILFSGCATVGPQIDNQELKKINEELRIKALKLKIERSVYVNNIGFRLLKNLPYQNKKSYGYLGILAAPLNKYIAKIFNKLENEDRVIIYGLVKGSAAEKSGLEVSDIILKINNRKISSYNFDYILKRIKPNLACQIEVERKSKLLKFTLYPQKIPYYINFLVVDSQQVNAAAFPGGVAVTYGLLNFIKNDDELGIVLGHELAHLIRGHILKSQGLDLAFFALALALGKNVDIPNSGDLGRILSSAFSATFSRDFEREADFFGTLLAYKSGFDIEKGVDIWERFAVELPQSLNNNFLASHPTSSERLLRIKKIVEEIKSGSIKLEDYLK